MTMGITVCFFNVEMSSGFWFEFVLLSLTSRTAICHFHLGTIGCVGEEMLFTGAPSTSR